LITTNKIAIINGISGQDGAYLAEYLLKLKYSVIGISRRENATYPGLDYLGITSNIKLITADLSNSEVCDQLMLQWQPDEFYNMGAQSSVSYSFEHPHETIQYNVLSVLNLLEAIRKTNPRIKFYQASSSEMYGKTNKLPLALDATLHPVSPYGISKATGHWLVNQYREAYGLFAVSGILFNHESYLRSETFFVKKVIKSAILIKDGKLDKLSIGNLDLRRDFGYAKEYIKAIWLMLQGDEPEDLQVCSGQSIALNEIANYVFDKMELNTQLIVEEPSLFRPVEIQDIFGDNTRIKSKGWQYDYTFYDVLDILMEEEQRNYAG
jgi:GDPmannose 4,6-dehydratase